MDWSADYRLYSKGGCEYTTMLFNTILTEVVAYPSSLPLVLALDDTLLPKTGKKIPGVKYTRDPMGPPFQVNFIRGQRVLQISAAVPAEDGSARMIPVLCKDAPAAVRPKRNAPPEAWTVYKEQQKQTSLSVYGKAALADINARVAAQSHARPVWITVDGSFTNKNILRHLPQRTTLIGRIRADARLFFPPVPSLRGGAGRIKIYGERAQTPEQMRQNALIPWQEIEAYAAGKKHRFKIKCVDTLRSPMSGDKNLRLIIIAPLAYRPSRKSRLLYRQPAYILCTDPNAPLELVLQAYLWRWDIEVNFRDEKTLLGLGQAQVRNQKSVSAIPQMVVAAYALLLIASMKAFGVNGIPDALPQPKWRTHVPKKRGTTQDMIRQLRWELWAHAIQKNNLASFAPSSTPDITYQKLYSNPFNALFYSMK